MMAFMSLSPRWKSHDACLDRVQGRGLEHALEALLELNQSNRSQRWEEYSSVHSLDLPRSAFFVESRFFFFKKIRISQDLLLFLLCILFCECFRLLSILTKDPLMQFPLVNFCPDQPRLLRIFFV